MRFQAWLTDPRVFIFGVPRRGLRECRQVAVQGSPASVWCRFPFHVGSSISRPCIIMISPPPDVWFGFGFLHERVPCRSAGVCRSDMPNWDSWHCWTNHIPAPVSADCPNACSSSSKHHLLVVVHQPSVPEGSSILKQEQ